MATDQFAISALPRVATPQLAAEIREHGILWSQPGQPIVGRTGVRADWMLYTYPLTLSARGGSLVADSMLPVLRTFEARQLVSVGYTAIPVMAACVLHSSGDFTGGCVRETRKKYGSQRRVEGELDRSRPVVLIDDSISSGSSIRTGISALEESGFEVEGVVALVHFPWRGGVEWARARGYRVETLVDIWRDVGMPRYDHLHGHDCVTVDWSDRSASAGQHPAVLAREVAAELLRSGQALLPPATLDRAYDARGGVFVSFRDRDSDQRLARSGFWHFDSAAADLARDVVLATVKTVNGSRGALARARLDRLKVAVSFFGPLRRVTQAGVDFDHLGIVVRSRAQPGKVGGALPHTQVFTSDLEQYRHAAFRNARLGRSEPHDIFVHEVEKHPEPGATWPPFGSSDDVDEVLPDAVGAMLTERAAGLLRAHVSGHDPHGPAVPDDAVPDPVHGVAVTLYDAGAVVGCCVSWDGPIDDCLARATRKAADDVRFADRRRVTDWDEVTVSVSVLRDRELLGSTSDLKVALTKVRPGEDSAAVVGRERCGLLLSQVMVHHEWSKEELARQLLAKARITEAPMSWSAFRTSSWVRTRDRVHRLRAGFPVRPAPDQDRGTLEATLGRLGDYLLGQLQPNGLPAYSYLPITGRSQVDGTAGRVVHALTTLALAGRVLGRAELTDAARTGLQEVARHVRAPESPHGVVVPGLTPSLAADAELLLGRRALGEAGDGDPLDEQLLARLVRTLRPDGRVDISERRSMRSDHDFLPGLVLLAIASAGRPLPDLQPQLDWYERRFHLVQPWGMVGWHPQAWSAVWQAGWQAPGVVRFVQRIADFALDRQSAGTGAFLTDLNLTGPSFHTAFVMEGLADAARLLWAAGHGDSAAACMRAWGEGFSFMDRLVITEADTYCMREPERAIGGVRPTPTSVTVRIDFVSHLAQSIVKALMFANESQLEAPHVR